MLSYTDLKPNTSFIKDGQPYIVLDYSFKKKQRQKPSVQLKIRNLITSKTQELSVHQNESFEEAEIKEVEVEFIYSHRGEFWFKNPDDPSDRMKIDEAIIEDAKNYLKEGLLVTLLEFNGDYLNIDLPVKVDLKVIQAPPNVKGSTVDGATKTVKTETDYEVKTPVFIEKGDIIKINTNTGEYVERTEKKN